MRSTASARLTPTVSSPNSKPSRKMCVPRSRRLVRNKRVRSSAMADQVLKFQPEQKIDSGKPTKKAGTDPRRRFIAGLRRYRRFLLMVVLPIVAVIAGFTFYLNGGRYVGTDDAY